MSGKQRGLLIAGSVITMIVAIYIGGVIYFMNHFYYNTTINGVNFSWKTAAETNEYFRKDMQEYALKVITKEGADEIIQGTDISIAYQENGEIERILVSQNKFAWPSMLWKKRKVEFQPDFKYDSAKLEEQIKDLQAFQNEGKVEPVNAAPEFDGKNFIAKPEILGTKVEQEKVQKAIVKAVKSFLKEVNLETENCYQQPKYTKTSEEIVEACNALNQYLEASITYHMPPKKEVIDKQLIATWLSWDENMTVSFHEEKVHQYMNEFAVQYESLYKTRSITTPTGKVTAVGGGTYGWAFDEEAEAEALIASIKNGEQIEKEPNYIQRAAVHEEQDWGKTYVEVDLAEQHMWYIVDGAIVFETDVVTGKPYQYTTPSGIYTILSMLRNTTLVGNIVPETGEPEYRTPVSYWMQVTRGGVGFHDANWQWAFGGDVYLYNGSHGCINMPVDAAGSFYNMVKNGTPVVLHY